MTSINQQTNNTFTCPIGKCGHKMPFHGKSVGRHVLADHPTVAKSLGLEIGSPAYFCKACTKYDIKPHAVCHECGNQNGTEKCFPDYDQLKVHLKEIHPKNTDVIYLETRCRHMTGCCRRLPQPGKHTCGFVHNDTMPEYFRLSDGIPKGFCRNEKPHLGQRCQNQDCTWAHARGRVKWLLSIQEKKEDDDHVFTLVTPPSQKVTFAKEDEVLSPDSDFEHC